MIPYHTDAPLYHWPVATAALILINSVLFFVVPRERLEMEQPIAQFGDAQFNPFAAAPLVAQNKAADRWNDDAFRIVDAPRGSRTGEKTGEDDEVVDVRTLEPIREVDPAQQAGVGRDEKVETTWLVLSLEHGTGLKPWQWLSSLFMHRDIVQLLLNVIALWAFGLVVEGKVGALVFVAIYLGIGILQAAVEQTLTLASVPSVSMGANAALFGLLGIAVVWAPRNEFDVLWGLGLRVRTLEIPILMYGFLQLALELIGISAGSFGVSSSLMHFLGLLMGLVVGWVWLRRGWVDCEGWDLINVWKGTEAGIPTDERLESEARQLVRNSIPSGPRPVVGKVAPAPMEVVSSTSPRAGRTVDGLNRLPVEARKSSKTKPVEAISESTVQQRLADIERLIAEGNLPLALKLLAKLRVEAPQSQLSRAVLFELIRALLIAKDYRAAIPFLREHIGQYSEQRIPLQLNLAKLLLHLQQPRKAIEILRAIKSLPLDDAARSTWKSLAHHAQHQIDEGVLELSD